ncbi:MAG: DUF2254 domain-containing protein [Candidatus Limnocylindrales bacterium]
MRASRVVLLEALRAQLWVVPAVAAMLAALLAAAVVWLDDATGSLGLPHPVGPESARAVLSAISGAMISFTALVFSITMLVLQSASTQLSPRVIRTFLRDRLNQSVLGLFVGTFVFSLLVLTAVTDERVPLIGVLVAVGSVLVAVLAFVAYIDHMANDIRPTSVIESIARETRDVIERIYPDVSHEDAGDEDVSPEDAGGDRSPPEGETDHLEVTWSGASGYIQALDREALLGIASRWSAPAYLLKGTGSFVVHGQPLLRIAGHAGTDLPDEPDLGSAVRVGSERSMAQDPEFGFRQLVDVALRALSPSLNDPSTANQSIDRLHELLRHLLPRDLPSPIVWRDEGKPFVSIPAPDWDAYVSLSVREISFACRSLPQVGRHLRRALEALVADASPERRAALRRAQLELDELLTQEPGG